MPAFSWRHEWLIISVLAAVGLVTRIAIALHPDGLVCGDTAIIALMAKHIWTGQAAPLFFYGQGYIGSLGAWLMAVFYGALGADLRGVLLAQVLEWVVAVPVLYRLMYAAGGRWGAVAALLALGLGTRPLYDTMAMLGYFEMLPLAACLFLLVARAATRGAGDRTGLAIGLLIGFGLWINPQFVAPAFAALAALWAASPTRMLLAGPGLAARVGTRLALEIRIGALSLVLAFAVAVAIVVGGAGRWEVLGHTVSVSHPDRYAVVFGLILLGGWLGIELALNPRRRAIALGVLGTLAGQIPILIYRLTGYDDRVHNVPVRFSSEQLARNARDSLPLACEVLFGETGLVPKGLTGTTANLADGTWPWILGTAMLASIVVVPVCRAVWGMMCAAGRAFVLAPVRVTLGATLALQACVALTCTLLHEELLQERYFDQLWLPYAFALAAGVGAVASRSRAWALLVLAVVVAHYGRDLGGVLAECREADVRTTLAELEAELVAHGVTVGYAHYDDAYLASYVSDERVRLSSYGGWLARIEAYRAEAMRTRCPVAVFAKTAFDRDNKESLERRHPDLIIDAWESPHWWFVVVRRPHAYGGHLEEIEGERPRD